MKNDISTDKKNFSISSLIHDVFFIMTFIILSICLLLNSNNYTYKKEFCLDNGALLILSLLFYVIIYILLLKIKDSFKVKKSTLVFIGITFSFLLFLNARNYAVLPGWDTWRVRTNAYYIGTNQLDEVQNDYYSRYPNNILITFLASLLYKVFSTDSATKIYGALLFINCTFVSFSGVFLFSIVATIYKDNRKALFAYIAYFFLVMMSPWVIVFYSDTFALFIITLTLLIYIKIKLESKKKNILLPIYFLLIFLGYYIKPQIAILFIATILIELFSILKYKKEKIMKTIIVGLLCFFIAFISMYFIKYHTYFKIDSEKRFGVLNYLVWGHNEKTGGVFSQEDYERSWDIPTNKERDDTNLKIFFEQIKTLGPSGLIRLYINKTLTNYNDGSFAFNNEYPFFIERYEAPIKILGDFYNNYYFDDGKNVAIFYTIQQFFWIGVLCLNVLAINKDEPHIISVSKLSIIGLTLFVLIFEARARFLYAFTPLYLIVAVQGIDSIHALIEKAINRS